MQAKPPRLVKLFRLPILAALALPFAAFAKICGANGQRVVNAKDLEKALSKAIGTEGPALVEIMTDAELV